MLKAEGVGEGPLMTETEVRVIVRVPETVLATFVVDVMVSVKIDVLLTDCVTVIVGVKVVVVSVRVVISRVMVVEGSTAVSIVVLVVGVAISRQWQASEMPAMPDVTSSLRKHLGRPNTWRFSLP